MDKLCNQGRSVALFIIMIHMPLAHCNVCLKGNAIDEWYLNSRSNVTELLLSFPVKYVMAPIKKLKAMRLQIIPPNY